MYCVLCTVHCVPCTVYCALCTAYRALCTVHCALCTVCCALCTLYRQKDTKFCICERNLQSDMRRHIAGSHSGVAEDTCLLVCDTVSLDTWFPTFRSFSMSLSSNDSTLDTGLQTPSQHRRPVRSITFQTTWIHHT